jgi:hypothetical protein
MPLSLRTTTRNLLIMLGVVGAAVAQSCVAAAQSVEAGPPNANEASSDPIVQDPGTDETSWGPPPDFYVPTYDWVLVEPNVDNEVWGWVASALSFAPTADPRWNHYAAIYRGPAEHSCEWRGAALRVSETVWYGVNRSGGWRRLATLVERVWGDIREQLYDGSGLRCVVRIEISEAAATFEPMESPGDPFGGCRGYCGMRMGPSRRVFELSQPPLPSCEYDNQVGDDGPLGERCDWDQVERHYPRPTEPPDR